MFVLYVNTVDVFTFFELLILLINVVTFEVDTIEVRNIGLFIVMKSEFQVWAWIMDDIESDE